MLNYPDSLFREIMDEIKMGTAEDTGTVASLPGSADTIPNPLGRQPNRSGGAQLGFKICRAVEMFGLRVLCNHGRRQKLSRQRLEKIKVVVEVNERFLLHAIGVHLSQAPESWVVIGHGIEVGAHVVERQAKLIDQQPSALIVRAQDGIRIMFTNRLIRQHPREQVMSRTRPARATRGGQRLGPM